MFKKDKSGCYTRDEILVKAAVDMKNQLIKTTAKHKIMLPENYIKHRAFINNFGGMKC